MKRINFFGATLCSAMLMATVSCSNNDLADDSATSNNGKVMMTATATSGSNNTQSRVVFGGNDGLTLNWEATDQIAVKVDDAATSMLTLKSGDGSTNATFEGEVTLPATPTKITACYPSKAFEGTDLTAQTGEQADAAHNLVMFASKEYAYNPSFSFNNKVSVLKLNMNVPDGVTAVNSVVISGAYAKGTLGTDGNWSTPTVADITLSAANIVSGKVVGYAVVIPGTPVKDLNIVVYTDKGAYTTEDYTSETATIKNNQVIEINKALVYVTTYTAADYYGYKEETCANCPTARQMVKYLKDGEYYWDDGSVKDNGLQTYIAPAITIFENQEIKQKQLGKLHTGLWLKKKANITGFDDNTGEQTFNGSIDETHKITAANADKIRTNSDYFFLPAIGYRDVYNHRYEYVAQHGYYWSKTEGYILLFDYNQVKVMYDEEYFSYSCPLLVVK